MNDNLLKQPILIEVGSYNTRVGFAGDQNPKKVYRTEKTNIKDRFNEVFTDALNIDSAQSQVIIIKNTGTNQAELQQEANVLFNEFAVEKCAFFNAQTATLFSWAHGYNGIIIDIGYQNTICIPVLVCVPQLDLSDFSVIAGKHIEEYIVKKLKESGADKQIIENNKHILLESLMKTYFYFECEADDFEFKLIEARKKMIENSIEIFDRNNEKIEINLPDPVLPNNILLSPFKAQKKSLIDCVIDFTNRCIDEIGAKTLERIIICGGGGKILGLRSILNRSLLKSTDLERAIKNYEIGIQNVPQQYENDSWVGASILFSLSYANEFFSESNEEIGFINKILEEKIIEELKNSSGEGKY